MARALGGITDQVIAETPISVLDFETTGLSPGPDRVLEVSVVRMEPGRSPRLVFDTLVDPGRRVAATSIHGITDEDVIGAPAFDEIAGDLVRALSDSVVAAYNVYFDLRFLEFELAGSGLACSPPHFCLMWMRPMLALGDRCGLGRALAQHGIAHTGAHTASGDCLASASLMEQYLSAMEARGRATALQVRAQLPPGSACRVACRPPGALPEPQVAGKIGAATDFGPAHPRRP
jgi:DNA polymerase-3 subunit epsilon